MTREIDYFNARIWGMYSSLLPESLYETLISAEGQDAWISVLLDTPYGEYFGPSADRNDSRTLYSVIDTSVAQRLHRLIKIASGRPAKALKVCLAEKDHQNLIAISSGIYYQATPLEILSGTLSGGILWSNQLEALASCRTTGEAADLLATWTYDYHHIYRKSLRNAGEKPLLEMRLDFTRDFMGALLEDARKCGYPVIRNFMGEKVDRANLTTALMWRTLPSDRDPLEFYIPGGPLVTRTIFFNMLRAPDLYEAIRCLPFGSFRKSCERAAYQQADTDTVSTFETSLEWQVIHRYSRPLFRDPLGAELMLAYLLRLHREGIRLKQSLTRMLFNIPMEMFKEISGYA